MDHFQTIYNQHADRYDQLVRCEDADGHLPEALARLCPGRHRRVAELGAGTGRLTEILAPSSQSIAAFDAALPMVALARKKLSRARVAHCSLAVAENSALPLPDSSVDLTAAGWSLGHTTGWFPESWKERVEKVLAEMERITFAGGKLLIIETLGTGVTEPEPPPGLVKYFELLEGKGFVKESIRTDYSFRSMAEAVELLGFFFGDEMAKQAETTGELRFPECTGLWIRNV